jgi:Fur family ferric uptake transcriptional regulator
VGGVTELPFQRDDGCAEHHAGGIDRLHRRPFDEPAARAWATELLGEVGLGATRPRVLVLAALRGRARPVTAQDLHWELGTHLRLGGSGGNVPGLTTVYRVLAVLAERGVLHCFHHNGGTTTYRLCRPARHDHLVCRCCGRVQEQPARPVHDWVAQPSAVDGFAVEDYHAELVGLCATCRPTSTRT